MPQLDVFAPDRDGWFGLLRDRTELDGGFPVVYFRRDGTVLWAADDLCAFAALLKTGGNWRNGMIPEKGVRLYPSKDAAAAELEFGKFSWDRKSGAP